MNLILNTVKNSNGSLITGEGTHISKQIYLDLNLTAVVSNRQGSQISVDWDRVNR